jgi:hypothetical protein
LFHDKKVLQNCQIFAATHPMAIGASHQRYHGAAVLPFGPNKGKLAGHWPVNIALCNRPRLHFVSAASSLGSARGFGFEIASSAQQ